MANNGPQGPYGEETGPAISRRAFFAGLLFWCAVAALGIALRGIRWEESFERAQALTGAMPYPEGHPLVQYARGAIGFHYYLTAGIMHFFPSPAVVCGYRDVLSAVFGILPFYVLGTLLTRNAWLGHVATVLGIAGIHLFFCSYYGLQVWPDKFTAGTIGQGYALFVLAAFMGQRWRTAFVLLGLMPIVHLGHMPVVLGTGLLVGFWLSRQRPAGWPLALASFLIALGVSLCFVFLIRHLGGSPPSDGPFYTDADPLDAWRRFTYFEDIHRAPTGTPRFGAFANSVMALVALLLVTSALYGRDRARRVTPSPFLWLLLFGLGTATAVGAAKVAQGVFGPNTPYVLIGWLPYRSPNLAAVLLVPLLVYASGLPRKACGQPRLLNLAVFAAALLGVRPLLGVIVPETFYQRYIAAPEAVLFFLFGVALVRLWSGLADSKTFRAVWAACVSLALAGLALEHQYGLALVAIGAIAAGCTAWMGPHWKAQWNRPAAGALAAGMALTMASLLVELRRDHLPMLEQNAFENAVADFLARESKPGELLLTPHWHLNWQEEVRHPVFLTFETPYFLPYMRHLAGTIEMMMADAYGIRFGQPWDYSLDAWRTRPAEEWRALGKKYGIRFVIVPNTLPTALVPEISGESQRLCRIP